MIIIGNTDLVTSEDKRLSLISGSSIGLDQSRCVIEDGREFLYRFTWKLVWRDGSHRCQFERVGETLFQSLPPKMNLRNVKSIDIYDTMGNGIYSGVPLLSIGVPYDAEADICYNCGTMLDGSCSSFRIYTYGWRNDSGESSYFYLDPRTEPATAWTGKNRVV